MKNTLTVSEQEETTGQVELRFIPYQEFARVRAAELPPDQRLRLLAAMCRYNAFSAVKKAGSGHLGSSLSCLDILIYLYFREMNILAQGLEDPNRDIFFSSKGHDCPGYYAVLMAAGILSFEKLLTLRRYGGLDGHPDIKIPAVEANSGSLGMGISKGKGMAAAKALSGHGGRVFVMTGDGELQEGQIFESLQTAVHQKINNLTVIVDNNKIQTDKPVKEIIDLGDLEKKFSCFGWCVRRCDGHDFAELAEAFGELGKIHNQPKVLLADTIKGRGISFMEGPAALKNNHGLYPWHSGAPADEQYEKGLQQLGQRVIDLGAQLGLGELATEVIETRPRNRVRLNDTAEKVVQAFGEALVEQGHKRLDLVVLDADLAADCGLRPFEQQFPARFFENGIAEQDMVSMAGGLALQGFLPVVNSFGVFLASRANEQIYANATELTKIIYVCHYAGLIPAGPGKSHQSLRDISLFGALFNCVSLEPCNAAETRLILEWCVEKADSICHLRLAISPSPRVIHLPADYRLEFGKGTVLKDGKDAAIFAYGPVMLHEALTAQELLTEDGVALKVINMPWLNRVDGTWLKSVVPGMKHIFVLDNHSDVGGLGDCLINAFMIDQSLRTCQIYKLGIHDYPACGTPQEALRHHQLDGESLRQRILKKLTCP